MNIYLHVESIVRELDSKLLLAVLAASKGHNVLVSNLAGITRGIHAGILPPGIFHTKSLTPGDDKITRHQQMKDRGFVITSIDEEGGLVDYGYEKFAKVRYSEKTINQASAIFSWGQEDAETLKRVYPKYSNKIFKTGSPRADLWKPFFSKYWASPVGKPKKPFLLISSNLGFFNNINNLHQIIKTHKNAGYYERDPEMFEQHFSSFAEEGFMMFAFIKAIEKLAKNNYGYDIVLRPHPEENINTWKIHLDNISNVHVIQNGPINPWVKYAFAVMHNGCTTALEATVSEKPVVTYVPFPQKYSRELANDLGYRVETLDQLFQKVNFLFENSQLNNQKTINKNISEIVNKKIYLDKEKLAVEKIVTVWEKLDNNKLSKSTNWIKLKGFLKIMKVRDFIKEKLKKIFPPKIDNKKNNYKFPPFKKKDLSERVLRLKNILGVDTNIKCTFISDKTVLIKKI